ncbi:MAG: hypothetical protein Satyrvirus49_3, partial [Satyrvirus sp.]
MFFSCINEKNIRSLAQLDQDDNDDLDKYNREREKIINLITVICCLYEQRSTQKLKLIATPVYVILNTILNFYNQIQEKMKNLGNPYEDEDCKNEE